MGLFDFLSPKARSREVTVHDFRDMLAREAMWLRDEKKADERIEKYVRSGRLGRSKEKGKEKVVIIQDKKLWELWKEHRLAKGRGLDYHKKR